MHGPLPVLKNGGFLNERSNATENLLFFLVVDSSWKQRTYCIYQNWSTLRSIKIGPHDDLLTQRTYKSLVCYTMICKLTQLTLGIIMFNSIFPLHTKTQNHQFKYSNVLRPMSQCKYNFLLMLTNNIISTNNKCDTLRPLGN